ncbi:MAG: hypothetical protein AABW67_06235 [Nanoarchaeota archaeon]
MAKKEIEPKIILEREYIIPLRREWLKVPEYKRANKAIKAIKEFLVKHMKVYDRDLRKIKIEQILNNEIRFRGMRKPQSKIKILAKKYDNDTVRVELVDVPAHVKFARLREEKANEAIEKNKKENPKEEIKPEEKKEETNEAKEKEQASKEEGLKLAKEQAKEMKHVSKDKNIRIQRKALAK